MVNTKWTAVVLAILLVVGSMGGNRAVAGQAENGEVVVADFSGIESGAFPPGWKAVWARDTLAKDIYSVVKEGDNAYLKAVADNSDILIAKEFIYDLKVYPFLQWSWRAEVLPEGADEREKDTGDSGAAVYVIFPGRFRPENIKYVWSSCLPVGTTSESPYNSKTKIVVLRNRSTSLGKWVSEEVNVYEDYKRLFEGDPGEVQAIAIMSDSNDTESKAVAHYDDIRISKSGAEEKAEERPPGKDSGKDSGDEPQSAGMPGASK